MLCFAPTRAAEDYSAWADGTDLILNTSSSGANVAGTVTSFPMLVRLNTGNFPFAQAQTKGQDIRFAKPDGTHLPYEIERWDANAKVAEVWVKVDTVKGNNATQRIRMLWGNASAADSSHSGDVFGAANGFVATWHLSEAGTGARPNAVAGGNAATPVNYDGNESVAGVIAGADSLDGAATGDYLNVGDGYADWSGGFSYSIWVYPTAVKKWSHVLDLGNGTGKDNIILNRSDTTNGLGFHNWNDTNNAALTANNQWALNQWQQFSVTVTGGKYVRLYKNGAQVLYDSLPNTLRNVTRTACYLGRSNWSADQYYQGKLDEPELSKVTRSGDWVKLNYQNQKSAQSIPSVQIQNQCAMKFSAPPDTSVPEGGTITLNAVADCASEFFWSVVSGPAPRMLDPEARSLLVAAPRVAGDTVIVYRLTGVFADSTRTRDMRLVIKEAIPEPNFSLPSVSAWTGKDSLAFKPVISNLAAIKASPDSTLHWKWSLSGLAVDTIQTADGLILKPTASEGTLQIALCIDNDGPPVCKSTSMAVSASVALRNMRDTDRKLSKQPKLPGRDALGRSPMAQSDARLRSYSPRFSQK